MGAHRSSRQMEDELPKGQTQKQKSIKTRIDKHENKTL